MPIIELDGVGFRHAGAESDALRDVRLAIDEGECVAILGPNGAGKTTLALTLNGSVPQLVAGDLRGTVAVGGLDATTTPVRELATSVGMVFDNPEFQMSQLTVAEEVALGLENLGVPWEDMRARIADALATVGLAGLEERVPLSLSGGQQQRLAIAAVLAMRPRVLVMDEPTAHLDPSGKGEVLEVARRLNRDHGLTIVMTEHDVDVVARYADRVVVLDEGTIVADGSPRDVLAMTGLLGRVGLQPPQSMALALRLRDGRAGWSEPLPLTADEAVDALERRFARVAR